MPRDGIISPYYGEEYQKEFFNYFYFWIQVKGLLESVFQNAQNRYTIFHQR